MKSPAFSRTVNASNYHGRRSISSSNQSKTTSTGIKVSVTQQMIPSRAAMRYGVMALLSPLLCGHCLDKDNRTVTIKTFFNYGAR